MEEKESQTSKEIKDLINDLRNSPNDEVFCENLQKYTQKLYTVGKELDKKIEEIKALKNNNHMLAITNAKKNMEILSLQKSNDDLKLELDELKNIQKENPANAKKESRVKI